MSEILKQLQAQKLALEQQIAEVIKTERVGQIAIVRDLVKTYDILPAEIFDANFKKARAVALVKYRHPQTGKTWTGRGKLPDWMRVENARQMFSIANVS